MVFFSDFFDFDLDESVELSSEDSLFGDFSVFASVFLVLLFEVDSALLFFSLVLVLVVFGLVAVSAAGLLLVAGLFVDFVEGDAVVAGTGVGVGLVLTLALAEGVMVAATEAVAAGVMVAPTLAVAAGVALAFVEAEVLVVVPVEVVPVVAVTPTLKLGVTP